MCLTQSLRWPQSLVQMGLRGKASSHLTCGHHCVPPVAHTEIKTYCSSSLSMSSRLSWDPHRKVRKARRTLEGKQEVPWKANGQERGEDMCICSGMFRNTSGLQGVDSPPGPSSHHPQPHRATSPSLFSVQKGTQTTQGGKCHPAGPRSTFQLFWLAWAYG